MKKILAVSTITLLFAITAGCMPNPPSVITQAQNNTQQPAQTKQNISDTVRFIAVGDMMLGRDVRRKMEKYGLDNPFKNTSALTEKIPSQYDFLLANLEGPVVTNPVTQGNTTTFGFIQDTAEILARNGFTLVSLGNNHTLDRSAKGYTETQQFLDAQGIEHFGHPKEIGDISYIIKEVGTTPHTQKIALIGLHDATISLDKETAIRLIQQVKPQADYTVVYIHWGIEYTHKPSARQQDLAHAFIDAGADIIIGHHSHVVQTIEKYNNHMIVYSLGNFIFDQYFSQDTQEGLAIGVTLSREPGTQADGIKTRLDLMPVKIETTVPRLMNDEERSDFFRRFLQWKKYTPESAEQIKQGFLE